MSRGRRALAIVGLLQVAAAAACGDDDDASAPNECPAETRAPLRVCPAPATVPGIDVSSYQGTIDWAKVRAAPREFAFVRAVKRDTQIDPTFSANWRGAKSANVLRGAYTFFAPSVAVDAQLAALVSALDAEGGLAKGDLPVVLDVEVDDGLPIDTVATRAKEWIAKASARFDVRPIVYTSASFATAMKGALADSPLWVANYKVTCPNLPDGWSSFAFWQSGQAAVAGISGDVDVDIFNGSRADLEALLVGAPRSMPDAGVFEGGPEGATPVAPCR